MHHHKHSLMIETTGVHFDGKILGVPRDVHRYKALRCRKASIMCPSCLIVAVDQIQKCLHPLSNAKQLF